MEDQLAIHRNKHVYKTCAYEVNDNARGKYNTDSEIIFKIATSKTSWCDYGDAYILVKETGIITVTGQLGAADEAAKCLNERNKWVIFKTCWPLTDGLSEINRLVNAKVNATS